jgi:hypothetical protein
VRGFIFVSKNWAGCFCLLFKIGSSRNVYTLWLVGSWVGAVVPRLSGVVMFVFLVLVVVVVLIIVLAYCSITTTITTTTTNRLGISVPLH